MDKHLGRLFKGQPLSIIMSHWVWDDHTVLECPWTLALGTPWVKLYVLRLSQFMIGITHFGIEEPNDYMLSLEPHLD